MAEYLCLGFIPARDLNLKREKGIWWMPWRSEAMKDVARCDKPRGGVEQPLIRGFPNGETHPLRYR